MCACMQLCIVMNCLIILNATQLTLVVPNAMLAADFSFVSKRRFGTYISL